jgi:hypothetical protein
MPVYPADIFTEPTDVDPDTLANLRPLRRLAGGWEGRRAARAGLVGPRSRVT